MASILRIDELQSPTGNRVALFNSNGSVEQISVNSLLVNNNIKFPTWTTSTRPTANLQVGYSGFNTQTNQVEVYNGTAWVIFTGSTSGSEFPTAYQSLINGFAGTKLYVKTTGSDGNAGTSESSPKATIQGAISAASTGSMIIVYPGTYTNNTSGNASGSSYSGQILTDEAKNLQIVCSPGQTKLTGSNSGARDLHSVGFRNSSSKLYGLIIERDNGGRTNNYSNAFIGFSAGEGISVTGQIYNCVFREVNSNGQWAMHYDNSGSANWLAEGCLFIGANWLGNYSGGGNTQTRYSASNNASWTTSGTFTGNQRPVAISSDWSVGSTSYGVYYGTYAWNQTAVKINYS
jgi:hypothetical protein